MDGEKRKSTKQVSVAGLKIGGGAPIVVQSMCNTDTRNVEETVAQIRRMEEAGCELVRLAVPDLEAAGAISKIKKQTAIPLVADIHFDYRLALAAMEAGVDKIRINPGNIGGEDRVQKVVAMAKERGIPMRIGVNAGSLSKELVEKYHGRTAEGLVESALQHVGIFERHHFYDIVISMKASSVPICIAAYTLLSEKAPYPLHVGVTEAGTVWSGSIKSAAGIGAILSRGIGDTIRVSLTGDPVEEVRTAKEILKSMELRRFGAELISCPTCGRTEIDMVPLANEVEKRLRGINKEITVAVMGCAVNGPGEASQADIGIAGGKGCGLIFKKGEILRKAPEDALLTELMKEIESL